MRASAARRHGLDAETIQRWANSDPSARRPLKHTSSETDVSPYGGRAVLYPNALMQPSLTQLVCLFLSLALARARFAERQRMPTYA